MAAGSTYSQIATTTLSSNTATYTFSNIPQTYTNLVLVTTHTASSGTNNQMILNINGDTGTNYSYTVVEAGASTATSDRNSNQPRAYLTYTSTNSAVSNNVTSFPQYQNTSTYKTMITQSGATNINIGARVNLWRSTAAITSIALAVYSSGVFATGSTFTLYGIKGA